MGGEAIAVAEDLYEIIAGCQRGIRLIIDRYGELAVVIGDLTGAGGCEALTVVIE